MSHVMALLTYHVSFIATIFYHYVIKHDDSLEFKKSQIYMGGSSKLLTNDNCSAVKKC